MCKQFVDKPMRIFNSSTTAGFFIDKTDNFKLDIGEENNGYNVLLDINESESLIICSCYVRDSSFLPVAIKQAEKIRRTIFSAIVDGSPDIMVSDRFYDGRWTDVEYVVSQDVPSAIVFPVCYQDKSINADEN